MCLGIYELQILRHHHTKQQCQRAQRMPRNHLNMLTLTEAYSIMHSCIDGPQSLICAADLQTQIAQPICTLLQLTCSTSLWWQVLNLYQKQTDVKHNVLIYWWFVFFRARGFLWVHHCVADRSDVELWSIYIWGEGAVGPSNWEPNLCQPAVLWEHKEQGTAGQEISEQDRIGDYHLIAATSSSHIVCCFIYIPLFPSLQPLLRPCPPPAPPHPLQAVTCRRLSDRCTAVWGISY